MSSQLKTLILIGVLKGVFVFMADLIRHLDFSLLALPVIPELRLTDMGLVDVNEFKVIR